MHTTMNSCVQYFININLNIDLNMNLNMNFYQIELMKLIELGWL